MIASLRTIYNGPPRVACRVTAANLQVGDFASVGGLHGVVERLQKHDGYGVRVRVCDEITGRFAGESTVPETAPAIARRVA